MKYSMPNLQTLLPHLSAKGGGGGGVDETRLNPITITRQSSDGEWLLNACCNLKKSLGNIQAVLQYNEQLIINSDIYS